MLIASFVFFLAIFVGVGIWATRGRDRTDEDYLLAGRSTHPILTALSAQTTSNSGFMFIGLIAAVYIGGLHWVWLIVGFFVGDLMMSFLVYPRFYQESVARNALTVPELLGRWGGKNYYYVRMLAALLTIILLSFYAAAQLQAGGKALSAMLDWEVQYGVLIGSAIVLSYCLVGGLRASIWTDAAQAAVMLLSMLLLVIYAIVETGGIGDFFSAANEISPTYLNVFPPDLPFFDPVSGSMLFILGWIFGGAGTIGQPHIMVRYMAMRSVDEMPLIRIYGYSWNGVFSLLAVGVGLAARVLLPAQEGFDAELGLPLLSLQLMPAILAGAMLAGVFSASLSTADSQILSCSATLTHDFSRGEPHPAFRTDEITTGIVIAFATLLALSANYLTVGNFSVFSLVLISWAGLAAAFGPIIVVYVLGGQPNQKTILAMMIIGFLTVLIWRETPMNAVSYSALPGAMAGFLVYAISLAFEQSHTEINAAPSPSQADGHKEKKSGQRLWGLPRRIMRLLWRTRGSRSA